MPPLSRPLTNTNSRKLLKNQLNLSDNYLDGYRFITVGTNWLAWQLSFKPRKRTLSGSGDVNFKYSYSPEVISGQRLKLTRYTDSNHDTVSAERFVGDAHESMAEIARTRSLPVGADRQAGGSISSTVNLDLEFGFTNDRIDHSGQFKRPIQTVYDLYTRILEALN